VPYTPPRLIRVKPPVVRDGAVGYIVSRALDVYGRPVAFAFAGEPSVADGSELFVRSSLLKRSLNYKSLLSGHSYPLFYDTLFADLRATLTGAVESARSASRGIWKSDRSTKGAAVANETDLEERQVLFPKLFRRLTSYFDAGHSGLSAFLPWLARTEEQVLDLRTSNFTHFDNVLSVHNGKIRLIVEPEDLVFVSAKTTSTVTAPWLAY
jgi:hypothetical protein